MLSIDRLQLIWLMLLGLAPGILSAAPDFPPPPHAKVAELAESMIVNGIPMDIRLFESRDSVEKILDFYRRHWPEGTKEKPGYTETDDMFPWIIITRAENGYLMTVQVKPQGNKGSSGYLAISRLPDPDNLPTLGEGFPKMKGSHVVTDIVSRDTGKKGRTLSIMNHYSVGTNANYYRDHFENRGWVTEMDLAISGGDSHTLRYRNGNKSVSIVINKGKATIVTAQVENAGLF